MYNMRIYYYIKSFYTYKSYINRPVLCSASVVKREKLNELL